MASTQRNSADVLPLVSVVIPPYRPQADRDGLLNNRAASCQIGWSSRCGSVALRSARSIFGQLCLDDQKAIRNLRKLHHIVLWARNVQDYLYPPGYWLTRKLPIVRVHQHRVELRAILQSGQPQSPKATSRSIAPLQFACGTCRGQPSEF